MTTEEALEKVKKIFPGLTAEQLSLIEELLDDMYDEGYRDAY